MFEKLIARILIFVLLFSFFGQGAIAEEEALHSLDELPFSEVTTEVEDERRDILDSLDAIVPDSDKVITEDTPPEDTHISFTFTGTEDVRLLLAEKTTYEKLAPPVLVPTLSIHPIQSLFSSGSDTLDSFLGISSLTGTVLFSMTGSVFLEDSIPESLSGKSLRLSRKMSMKQKVATMKGNISVDIPSGTIIQDSSGTIISSTEIGVGVLSSEQKTLAKKKHEKSLKNRGNIKKGLSSADPEGFEFGITGKHLIFSQPVKVTIDVPNMTDGNVVDLLTMHTGDADFNTSGLAVDPDTLCNNDGTATIAGSQAIVKNGKVSFYTCGASSFTMNPSGGIAGSNDVRLVVGDCGQVQIYYNAQMQIYTGNPPATGCSTASTMDAWPVLRIGGTSYGNDFTAWSTNTTTGSTNGNTYTATSTMTRVVGGLTYTLIIDWSYTAPNKYITLSWRMTIPATNTNNVRFYYGMDSFVAGGDASDVGYLSSTGGLTFGVYDSTANVLSAFRYMSGQTWTAYEAGPLATVRGRIAGGTNFANTITASTDLGYGVNWDLGTTAGTYSGTLQWTLAPYVAANVPDIIPGIGTPEGPLTSNLQSQMPITVTNVGNLSSSGVHTVVLSIPANVNGPTSAFSDNGWSCGAQVGTGVTCTKTTTISTPMGEETFRIPVTPTTAASGTTVTFNVSVANPGDSNVTNNTAFASNSVVGGVSYDPGGVTGENLWLQSGTGTNCVATGCTVTTWANQGGLGAAANAVTGLGTVTYDPTNRINGNPTLYFNGASLNTNNNLGLPTRANSIFAVTRIGAGGDFYMGTQTVTNNTRSWRTSTTADQWMRYNSTIYYNGVNNRAANVPAITSTIRQTAGASAGYMNGRSILTSADTTTFTVNNFGIGRVGNTNSTLSNVAEVIIYNTAITAAQQKQVESYLALKYGITLDQTAATDYVLSNGVVIWNAVSAGVYNKNIAGIARDDTSSLNQLRSQSVTATGDIIVAKASIGTNRNALLWANNAGQIATFTGTDAPIGSMRIGREWQFQEKNGDIGTVVVSYPSTSVPSGMQGPLMLFTDADGTFSGSTSSYTGTYNTGATSWDFSLNIPDSQYVTFGYMLPSDSTPPNILSIGIASGTLIPKGTFTLSTTYTDTGVGINPSSLTGGIYSWDATGATWNPTNIAGAYMTYGDIPTTSSGVFDVSNLPFGKYRFDISIADTLGNTRTTSYTYFVDAIEWTVSMPTYTINDAPLGTNTFGSGEVIVTVRTVGAGFDLSMIRTNDLTYITDIIPVFAAGTGWGYSQWNGTSFPTTITSHGTTQTLANIPKNINQNGQKNTFTYRLKYGVNPPANAGAGDYQGQVRFRINLTY